MATRSPNALPKRERDRRRQRDLGHEQQHAAAAAAHFGREPQIELGLAAAGDAVQQRGLEVAALDERAQTASAASCSVGQDERRTFRRRR